MRSGPLAGSDILMFKSAADCQSFMSLPAIVDEFCKTARSAPALAAAIAPLSVAICTSVGSGGAAPTPAPAAKPAPALANNSEGQGPTLGPLPSEPCPSYLPRKYKNGGFIGKSAVIGDIAKCAHSSAANVWAFIQAYSATTGDPTGEEAVQVLIKFSGAIIINPPAAESCFNALGVQPKDKQGNWRDSVDLLTAFVQAAPAVKNQMHTACYGSID